MSTPKIALAYSIDNIQFAEEIDSRISDSSPYRFEHFYGKKTTDPPSISEQLKNFEGPILLIITDNFLKSAQCMNKGLALLQTKGDRILPIIASGYAKDEENGEALSIPTNFERVSDIIQYINYWQDQYLDLRRQKRQIRGLDEVKFNTHLKVMREISSEAGEFLRLLRNKEYLTYEDFSGDHFRKFFEFVNDLPTYESFRKKDAERPQTEGKAASATDMPLFEAHPEEEDEPAMEVDLSQIPGIDLLEENQKTDESRPAEEEPTATAGEGNPEAEQQTPEASLEFEMEETVQMTNEPLPHEEEEEEEEEEEQAFADAGEALQQAAEFAGQGSGEQGLKILERAIGQFGDDADLRYQYAMYLVQFNQDIPGAMSQLSHVLEKEPMHPKCNFLMGELSELKEDFASARTFYEQVAAQADDYPGIFFRLGLIIANHFPEDKEEAASNYTRAMEKDPENIEACYQLALLLNEQMENPEQAIPYFEKTLTMQPDHPFANYDLALIYHQQGDMQKALEYYREAIKLNPELQTPENDLAFGHKPESGAEKPTPPTTEEEAAVTAPLQKNAEALEASPAEGFEPAPTRPEEEATVETPVATNGKESGPMASKPEDTDPLEALKQNVRRLEEMFKSREHAGVESKINAEGKGKIVMITGATSWLGRATAKEFAEHGYRLILTGRDREKLDRIHEVFETVFHAEVKTLCFDVKSLEEIAKIFQELPFEWRQIDIIVNIAGSAKGVDLIHSGRLEDWQEMIDTNLKGLLFLSKAFLPYMVRRRNGHIINVASKPENDSSNFVVDALTKSMRGDLLKYNVRVSQISPGIASEGAGDKGQKNNDSMLLNPRDVAETIFFIATRPSHINIQDVVITGTRQAESDFFGLMGGQSAEMAEEEPMVLSKSEEDKED